LILILLHIVEAKCELMQNLTDVTATEGDALTLSIHLTKPRNVVWMRGSDPVAFDDRCQATVDDTGTEHALVLSAVTMEDSGEYASRVNDNLYGIMTAACKVTIKGKYREA